MKILQSIFGDQFRAQYSNTKFYIKQITILIIKSLLLLSGSLSVLIILFMILTPDPIQQKVTPVFQVKKSSQNNMITIYTNNQEKQNFCNNQTLIYYGKLYSKQQYCQFEHENFPFQMTNRNFVDISLEGVDDNVQYITACLVKMNSDRSVCQKFAYKEEIQIFNNLMVEELYSVEIQLVIKKANQYFGEISVVFKKELNIFIRLLNQYYFWISSLASIIMAGLLTFSFVVFQIAQIMQKVPKQQKKLQSKRRKYQ